MRVFGFLSRGIVFLAVGFVLGVLYNQGKVHFPSLSLIPIAHADTIDNITWSLSEDQTQILLSCDPELLIGEPFGGEENHSGEYLVYWHTLGSTYEPEQAQTSGLSTVCNTAITAESQQGNGSYGEAEGVYDNFVITLSPDYSPFDVDTDYPYCYDGQGKNLTQCEDMGSQVLIPYSENLHRACSITDETLGTAHYYWSTDQSQTVAACATWAPPGEEATTTASTTPAMDKNTLFVYGVIIFLLCIPVWGRIFKL